MSKGEGKGKKSQTIIQVALNQAAHHLKEVNHLRTNKMLAESHEDLSKAEVLLGLCWKFSSMVNSSSPPINLEEMYRKLCTEFKVKPVAGSEGIK